MYNLYSDPRLKEQVLKWVNLKRIKKKEYSQADPRYLKQLKLFTQKLANSNVKFEFNKFSIETILKEYWGL